MTTYYPESFVQELTAAVARVAREVGEREAAAEADQQRLAGKRAGLARLQATLARVQQR